MTRVLSGAVLVGLAVTVVWLAPPLVFLLVAQALLVAGVWEYAGLSRVLAASGLTPVVVLAAVAASVTLARGGSEGAVLVILFTVLLGLGTAAMRRWDGGPDALAMITAALFPTVYLGLPIGALVLIRERQGAAGLFLLMLTVMISDTAQYYTGRLFGHRPLAATISPKKTMEGALGGFVFGPLAFALLSPEWLPQPPLSWAARLALGAAIVAAGIAGDLFESMLKRSAGVKDSSALIPGHGGVLDRIDALLFAAPVYFVAVTYL
ncbi:MAG: phosphatidate cytidylyltransferase [Vicinamibacterales bacterium]